jgi:hypothetical protein
VLFGQQKIILLITTDCPQAKIVAIRLKSILKKPAQYSDMAMFSRELPGIGFYVHAGIYQALLSHPTDRLKTSNVIAHSMLPSGIWCRECCQIHSRILIGLSCSIARTNALFRFQLQSNAHSPHSKTQTWLAAAAIQKCSCSIIFQSF